MGGLLSRSTVMAVIGAVVAVLLQIMLAPIITIGHGVPDFIAAFCVARAVACPDRAGAVLPFACGLLFDLLGNGPVGGMALTLVIVCALASLAMRVLNNDTLFMPMAIVAGGIVLVEMIYGIIVLACGSDVGFADAFIYIGLPCTLYDIILALIMYPIAARLMVEKPLGSQGMPILR